MLTNAVHEELLVSPKQQLGLVSADTMERYALAMAAECSKAKSTLQDSLFTRSFLKNADVFHSAACETARNNGVTAAVVMPPLVLRADETVVFKIKQLLVVCFSSGPMIPVVPHPVPDECKGILVKLYSLHSQKFINSSNFQALFEDD